ncbi:hypothetical protein [Rivihabitans pingtungensis]|uniref:hypothetical protein n=1 Tax=Rivihabitans pingtungensis TaxID=1054498 RepID=UPI0011B3BB3A|nr:hypothetical protein [Rivihabitans pingtungensis]
MASSLKSKLAKAVTIAAGSRLVVRQNAAFPPVRDLPILPADSAPPALRDGGKTLIYKKI